MEEYRSFSFGSLQSCSLVLSLCALIATLFQILQRDENDNVGLKPAVKSKFYICTVHFFLHSLIGNAKFEIKRPNSQNPRICCLYDLHHIRNTVIFRIIVEYWCACKCTDFLVYFGSHAIKICF